MPEEEETLLVATLADLPQESAPPPGVELRDVVDEAGVDLLVRVHDEVFGGHWPALRARLLAELEGDTIQAVVAMAGDRPVCGGRVEFHHGTEFASLWGGGTLPEWRGRGAFRAVVARRAALAAARGHRYLQTDASPQSRPILERLGFQALATTTPYVHP